MKARTAAARYRYTRRPLDSLSEWMYRHIRTNRDTAQNIMMMSLRPKRLKYSRAGERVSMIAAMSAPRRPMWSRRNQGRAARAVPKSAYPRRDVKSLSPRMVNMAATISIWNGPCIQAEWK